MPVFDISAVITQAMTIHTATSMPEAPRAAGWDMCSDCVAAHEKASAKRMTRRELEADRGDYLNDEAKGLKVAP